MAAAAAPSLATMCARGAVADAAATGGLEQQRQADSPNMDADTHVDAYRLPWGPPQHPT